MAFRPPITFSTTRSALDPRGGAFGVVWLILLYGVFGFLVLLIGLLSGLSYESPMLMGTYIGMAIVAPVMWYRPSLGAYILIAGAALFESFPLGFVDSIFDHSVFYQTFRSGGGANFMLFNAAEVIMGFALLTVILRRIASREKTLELGPMFIPIGLYSVFVAFGLLYGVGRGGHIPTALWEARGQLYILLGYLIVVNTFNDKKQIVRLMWVFLIGITIKGIVGSWRLLVTLGGDLERMSELSRNNTNSFMAHEESVFFALLIIFAFILFMFRSHKGQFFFLLLAATPVALPFLANQRRLGILVAIIGIMLVFFFAYWLVKERRKFIMSLMILGALMSPGFIAATWNSEGFIGEPARAIRSAIDPSARDASSDEGREIEAFNMKQNIFMSPLLGRGYGHEIILFIPAPWIGDIFYFWDIVPHHTILWVWMRTGTFGFMAFWFMIGSGVVAATIAAKRTKDRYLQGVAVLAVVSLTSWLLTGALDMGIVDPRQTTLIGTMLGVIAVLAAITKREAAARSASE